MTDAVTLYHDVEQDIDSPADPAACRRVVSAFLALEARYSVPATYNVVGRLFQEQPDLIEEISDAGQEVAFHSYHHPSDWQAADFADEVALCRRVSFDPKGYRSPRSQWSESTLISAWDNGFAWNAEADPAKSPYFVHEGLARLPIADDDWALQTGEATPEGWVEHFQRSLDDPGYLAFGAHDSVASLAPQVRLAAWERVLQAVAHSGRRALTFSDATDRFRRAALSDYYSANAGAWNGATRRLYRTRRFREMIRAEAEKLERPVVADLGSAGGVLTAPLKDVASLVHCVDSAEGMLAEVDSHGCIQPRLGDVTESGLPDESIDLVVCARVIEYLLWPERLGHEIRRIARPGATYVVTFPATRADAPGRGESAPDRIRRSFTPEEVRRWAAQVGRGRLIGVQYAPAEPEDRAAELRYRALEREPPPDITPTNWVYIGRVGDTAAQHGEP